MDGWETHPYRYERRAVQLVDKEGETFEGYAYFWVLDKHYVGVSNDYKRACVLTSMAYHYLPPKESLEEIDYTKYTIPIINATTGEKEEDFTLEDIDYDDDTKDLIFNP